MDRAPKLIAASLVGFVAAVAIGWLVWSDDGSQSTDGVPAVTSFPAIYHDPAAASDLEVAWRAWRSGTFVVQGTWTRTLDSGGSPLTGPTLVVQDPPRRVVQRLGAIVELFDDRVAACEPVTGGDPSATDATDAVGAAPCVSGQAGLSYDERVTIELATVADYVTGVNRIYDVDRGPIEGCFRAELSVSALASPWGRWAQFCFDSDTGAMISSRVRRQSAVDVEAGSVVSVAVSDADYPESP